MAKNGGRIAPSSGRPDIMTSLRSTTSHGESPIRDSHSRKPAYCIADRRDSHAIFRGPRVSASRQNFFESRAMLGHPTHPSSFSIHFNRKGKSEESIGPRLKSSKDEIT